MDLFISFILLGIVTVLLTYILQRKSSAATVLQVPGWDQAPFDSKTGDLGEALSTGSLGEFLIQKHRGGKCPVTSFWWRDKRVVSVSSPRAFKETAHIYDRPKHIFGPCFEPLHGAWSIQSLNGNEWKERKSLLHKTVRGKCLEGFFSDIRPCKKNYLFIIPARADFSARPPSFYSLCSCATAGQRASKTTAMPVVELVQSPWYAPTTLHRWLMF